MKKLLLNLLLMYSHTLPYHRGKWQVVERLIKLCGLQPYLKSLEIEAVRQGVRWNLKPGCLVQRAVYLLGVYEIHETRWLKKHIQPDWVVLDIGSNFGYYSMMIASLAAESTIFAFEPHSGSFAALSKNKNLNGFDQVQPQQLALSNEDGFLNLVVPPTGNEGIGHVEALDVEVSSDHHVEKVRTLPLDSFAAEQSISRIDFIKIDVEGAELMVLEGGRKTIESCKPKMLIEVNPEALEGFGRTADELITLIRDMGYRTYRIHGSELEELKDASTIGDYVNAVCIPV